MRILRTHLTYANVTATIALFVALGGTGYAALSLPKNSVGTAQLKRQAVTNSRIHRGTITSNRIHKNSITGTQIRDHSIKGSDIDVGDLGVIPEARHAASADNAGKVGGVTVDQLKDRCPAGTRADAGGCMETTLRAATDWTNAAGTCARILGTQGGRLPTMAELVQIPNSLGSGDIAEWTSNVISAVDPPQVVLRNVTAGSTSSDTTNHEHQFRCVFLPTNQ